MKNTGIIRKVDNLGRIVLPKELRAVMDIKDHDPLEIFLNDDGDIVIHKYRNGCCFCGSTTDVVYYMGYQLCRKCAANLSEALHN